MAVEQRLWGSYHGTEPATPPAPKISSSDCDWGSPNRHQKNHISRSCFFPTSRPTDRRCNAKRARNCKHSCFSLEPACPLIMAMRCKPDRMTTAANCGELTCTERLKSAAEARFWGSAVPLPTGIVSKDTDDRDDASLQFLTRQETQHNPYR